MDNQPKPNHQKEEVHVKKENKIEKILALVGVGLIGLLLFAAGIYVEKVINVHHDIYYTALGHFLLILGEAVMVFIGVNIILETPHKEKILRTVKDRSQEMINEVQNTLSLKTTDLSNEISRKTEELSSKISGNIVKIFLRETTSPEIAEEIENNPFFRSDFMKTSNKTDYAFSIDPSDAGFMILKQTDEFFLKNISKIIKDYDMHLSLTSTSSKSFEFKRTGYCDPDGNFIEMAIDDSNFDIHPIPNVSKGVTYTLKESKKLKIESQNGITIKRVIEGRFQINRDGVDDYFFTRQYITSLALNVICPDNYEFNLYPTFPEDKLRIYKDMNSVKYSLPFLFPGQGYNFLLKEKKQ